MTDTDKCSHSMAYIEKSGIKHCPTCDTSWGKSAAEIREIERKETDRLAFRAYACAYIMGTADQYDMDDDMEVANAGTNALRSHAIRVARAMLQAEKDEYGE